MTGASQEEQQNIRLLLSHHNIESIMLRMNNDGAKKLIYLTGRPILLWSVC